jgi:hypothetical protein
VRSVDGVEQNVLVRRRLKPSDAGRNKYPMPLS